MDELTQVIACGPITGCLSDSCTADEIGQQLGLNDHPATGQRLQDARPLAIRKRGNETRLVLGETVRRDPDPSVVELLVDARRRGRQVFEADVCSLRVFARRLGREHRAIARALTLAFLAPVIAEAILDGRGWRRQS